MSVQRRQSQSGLRYDVRYRDRAGRVVTKTLRTKRDAEAFEADQRTALRNGVWIDPRLGDRKFVDVAAERLASNPASGRQRGLVAEANDVPVTTARRWVKEARRRGFLPPGRAGRVAWCASEDSEPSGGCRRSGGWSDGLRKGEADDESSIDNHRGRRDSRCPGQDAVLLAVQGRRASGEEGRKTPAVFRSRRPGVARQPCGLTQALIDESASTKLGGSCLVAVPMVELLIPDDDTALRMPKNDAVRPDHVRELILGRGGMGGLPWLAPAEVWKHEAIERPATGLWAKRGNR